jgi:hypothetical protein
MADGVDNEQSKITKEKKADNPERVNLEDWAGLGSGVTQEIQLMRAAITITRTSDNDNGNDNDNNHDNGSG